MTPACTQNRCNGGREHCPCEGECQVTVPLPPLFVWIRREWIARAEIPRWYRTNRIGGFRRTRALWLAWRTTNPIPSTKELR